MRPAGSRSDRQLRHAAVGLRIRTFEPDREIAWYASGNFDIGHFYGYAIEPAEEGHSIVTSYYDWSEIDESWHQANIFPVISEGALRATLGILARTVKDA